MLIPYIMALQLLRRMQTKGKKLKKQTVRLLRVVVILLDDKHLERQRKRQVFQSQQNIKLTNLYLMELQKIELCMNLMYVERRNTL